MALQRGINLRGFLGFGLVEPLYYALEVPLFRRFERREELGEQDLRSLADYLAASFNLLEEREQDLVLANLRDTVPNIPWQTALIPIDNEKGEEKGSDFDEGSGPSGLPPVTMDNLVGLLKDVSTMRNSY